MTRISFENECTNSIASANSIAPTVYLWLLWSLLFKHKINFFTHVISYIHEQLSVVSTASNVSILAPFSKQTESSHSPREIGRPTTSHWWLSLAILGLACPDLAADCRLNSNTYKSYRYASWLQQYKAQHYFFLCMFLVNQQFLYRNFLLCCPSQRSARSHVPSQVATHQEIGKQLWAGEMPDSNPGLEDNNLARYHWATTPPRHSIMAKRHTFTTFLHFTLNYEHNG